MGLRRRRGVEIFFLRRVGGRGGRVDIFAFFIIGVFYGYIVRLFSLN